MNLVGSEQDFVGTFRIAEVDFSGPEKFGPSRLTIIHNGFGPPNWTYNDSRFRVIVKV